MRKYYKHILANKLDNVGKIENSQGHKLPTLIQGKRKENELHIKLQEWFNNLKTSHKEKPEYVYFTCEFSQTFKKIINIDPLQTFPYHKREKEYFLTQSTNPVLSWCQNQRSIKKIPK